MAGGQFQIAICVPVRNEEQLLPDLLRSLAAQRGVDAKSVCLCFFLDACDDDSLGVLKAVPPDFPFARRLEQSDDPAPSNAGRARRRAMALGLEALGNDDAGVLLTTDADTIPAPDWVIANLAALRRADLVTGDIRQHENGFSQHHARVKAYFDRLHLLNALIDPVPWQATERHHHAGGASMALTCATYLSLGGFTEIARGEDAALVSVARQHGYRVRRDASVIVHTSMRREGRVEGGFAAHLHSLDEAGTAADLLVVDPHVAARQYRAHARARRVFRAPSKTALASLAEHVGVEAAAVSSLLANCGTDEAFAVRLVPMPVEAPPLPLAEAERRLARLVGHRRTLRHRPT